MFWILSPYPCLTLLQTFSGRVNYEESMMVRLSVSKREKGLRKRASAMSSQLHSLTHFSDISALTGGTAHLDVVSVGYNGSRSHHSVSHTWAFHTASSGRVLVLRIQYYPLLLFVCRTRILLKSGRRYPRKVGRRKVRAPVGALDAMESLSWHTSGLVSLFHDSH